MLMPRFLFFCVVLVLIGVGGDRCHGLPVSDSDAASSPAPPTATTATTTPSSVPVSSDMVPRLEPEAQSLDDLLPGTTTTTTTLSPEPTTAVTEPSPRGALTFVDAPQHTETELGAAVLLPCRTAEPVVECRWSWQPLPPTSLPLPNIEDSSPRQPMLEVAANASTTPTTSTTVVSLSLPVRTFAAFGNASNDCSVRFSSTKHEQTGYWTCAARRREEDTFTSTAPAKLSIVQVNTVAPIKFAPQETALETPAATGARLPCRTLSPVRECQWSWRQLNQSQPWDVEMRKFPASGENNESNNCDLGLPAVRSEHEGFWTCGARVAPNSPFAQAQPIRLLISEVEFVQLSRGIQITAGETVFLRCLVNKPVYQCEWSWRPSNSSRNSTRVRQFEPSRDVSDHDCSVRFRNIVYDEEGLWTCGVRLTPAGILHEAPSTTVTLLPSGKVNFTETPETTSGAIGSEATLRCATNGRVERCAWSWKALSSSADTESTTLHEFPSHGDLGRNCSLSLHSLGMDEQGYWTCQVFLAGQNGVVMTTTPAKLTVYEEEDVKFSELSQDIQVSSGGTVSLRCVTLARVEQCRWSLTPDATANTTVVIKQFAPAGTEARDCSVKLSHALQEQEGLWTCGARLHAKQNYTDAPPARLSLIEPEPITVTVWGVIHQTVNLACKTGLLAAHETQCFWTHGEHLRLSVPRNATTRKTKHTVSMNHSTGVCSLQFTPTDSRDFGEWICDFVVENEHMSGELGSASILLIDNSPDQQLGWLVGAITSTVLFILIMAVVMVVCKTRLCTRKIPAFLETLPPATTSTTRGNGVAKIDLSYANPNFLAAPESISNVLPNRSPHMYDRVGKRELSSTMTYENVKET